MILVPGFKLPHQGKAFLLCSIWTPDSSTWEHNQWLFSITRFQSNLLNSQSNWNRKGGYYLHYKLWYRTQSYKGNFANIWLTHYMLILLVLLSELWDAQKMLGPSSKFWLPVCVGSQFLGCMLFRWKGPWASWLLLHVNESLSNMCLPETLEEATLFTRELL